MTKKKVIKKKPAEVKHMTQGMEAKRIILQQCSTKSEAFDKHKAHFLIWQDGTITKGLALGEVGGHCKDFDHNSIGVVMEGKFNRPQQKALINVIYTVFTELKEKIEVKPYSIFHPGKVNPNLNIRSVMREYVSTYETKRVKATPRPVVRRSAKKIFKGGLSNG